MSGSLNRAQLIGNLGADPEVRAAQSGAKIVTLSIATSARWKDEATGERRERTEWHRVVIFNAKLGEVVEKHLKKGAKVFLEGSIHTRKWQDKEGVDRYSTEIQLSPFNGTLTFLDRKPDGDDIQPLEAGPSPTVEADEEATAESTSTRRPKKAKA